MNEVNRHISRLASEDGHGRPQAIRWLSEHPEISRTPLHDLLRSQVNSWWKGGAIETLRKMPAPEDLPLLDSLATDSALRFWALWAVAAHSDPEAFDILKRHATADEEPHVAEAILAMGHSADARARETLEQWLHNPSAYLRWKAAHALTTLGAAPSRPALTRQLAVETDPEVREKLQAALR